MADNTDLTKEIIEEKIKSTEEKAYDIMDMFNKSNLFINAKYKSSALEEKIMTLSFADRHNWTEEEDGMLVSKMKASYIKKELGYSKNNTSLYRDLNVMAESMTGRNIGITDDKNESFCYIAVVIKSKYENGELSIYYNPELKKYLLEIEKTGNYTQLSKRLILGFKSYYTIRLYQMLKSKCYTPKSVKEKKGVYRIYYNLAEFKLELGVVNSELSVVKKYLADKRNPDYEKAVDASPEKKFNTWYELRRQVLDPAIKEINQSTDMKIEYEAIKKGTGGKVAGLYFIVQKLNEIAMEDNIEKADEEKTPLTEAERDEYIEWLSELIEPQLKIKDLRAIAEASQYDKELAMIANKIYEPQKERVQNIVGFFISAIRENYELPNDIVLKKKNTFNDFEQRQDYGDMKQLELNLLAN